MRNEISCKTAFVRADTQTAQSSRCTQLLKRYKLLAFLLSCRKLSHISTAALLIGWTVEISADFSSYLESLTHSSVCVCVGFFSPGVSHMLPALVCINQTHQVGHAPSLCRRPLINVCCSPLVMISSSALLFLPAAHHVLCVMKAGVCIHPSVCVF